MNQLLENNTDKEIADLRCSDNKFERPFNNHEVSLRFYKTKCKSIPGIANITLYESNRGENAAIIKPGFGFPGTSKLFNVREVNKKLKFASCFTDKVTDTKLISVNQVQHSQLNLNKTKNVGVKYAIFEVYRNKSVSNYSVAIAKIRKKIYVIAKEQSTVDFGNFKNFINMFN